MFLLAEGSVRRFPLIPLLPREATQPKVGYKVPKGDVSINSTSTKRSDGRHSGSQAGYPGVSINSTSTKRSDLNLKKAFYSLSLAFPLIPLLQREATIRQKCHKLAGSMQFPLIPLLQREATRLRILYLVSRKP